MNNKVLTITSALLELRTACKLCGTSDADAIALMQKYDMVIGGKNLNEIPSSFLVHSLNDYWNCPITLAELNQLLPDICKSLNMECNVMILAKDIYSSDPPVHSYQIKLF